MKVKDLIEALQRHPPDFNVELSKVMAIDEAFGAFEIVLDSPIVAIAVHGGDREVRMVIDNTHIETAFGKITRLGRMTEVKGG